MNTPKRQKQFRAYKNAGGKSVVRRYELAKDGITVVFADHSVYRWTNQSADRAHIAKMKELAVAGKGLGTYIETHVKDRFLKKIR